MPAAKPKTLAEYPPDIVDLNLIKKAMGLAASLKVLPEEIAEANQTGNPSTLTMTNVVRLREVLGDKMTTLHTEYNSTKKNYDNLSGLNVQLTTHQTAVKTNKVRLERVAHKPYLPPAPNFFNRLMAEPMPGIFNRFIRMFIPNSVIDSNRSMYGKYDSTFAGHQKLTREETELRKQVLHDEKKVLELQTAIAQKTNLTDIKDTLVTSASDLSRTETTLSQLETSVNTLESQIIRLNTDNQKTQEVQQDLDQQDTSTHNP